MLKTFTWDRMFLLRRKKKTYLIWTQRQYFTGQKLQYLFCQASYYFSHHNMYLSSFFFWDHSQNKKTSCMRTLCRGKKKGLHMSTEIEVPESPHSNQKQKEFQTLPANTSNWGKTVKQVVPPMMEQKKLFRKADTSKMWFPYHSITKKRQRQQIKRGKFE